jgi:hypothetical protein
MTQFPFIISTSNEAKPSQSINFPHSKWARVKLKGFEFNRSKAGLKMDWNLTKPKSDL